MSIAEKLQTIAENEQLVYNAGYEKGKSEGGGSAEYDKLWDTLQENGNRRSYQYAFYNTSLTWTDEIYNPKYPIICDNSTAYTATSIFHGNSKITDTKVPITIIGTRMDNTFMNCTRLKRIPSLTVENLTRIVNAFQNCTSLETLIMHGVLDVDGLDLHWSTNLSKESIESIIGTLSTETENKAITLSKVAVNSAFETADGLNDGENSKAWNDLVGLRYMWSISLV